MQLIAYIHQNVHVIRNFDWHTSGDISASAASGRIFSPKYASPKIYLRMKDILSHLKEIRIQARLGNFHRQSSPLLAVQYLSLEKSRPTPMACKIKGKRLKGHWGNHAVAETD